LMETEIWPRLIYEAKISGARVAIVNGRLSERSLARYQMASNFIRRILDNVDAALTQSEPDAERIKALGFEPKRVVVTGNLKFDISAEHFESELTDLFQRRFRQHGTRPVIVAASTHEPEERILLASLQDLLPYHAKLFIAPRHPDRFEAVWDLLNSSSYRVVRRSDPGSENDRSSDVILLDSIGELRSLFPIAEIVFVGGSLIPHGGQSILEPAAAGKAIVTGPYTHNFKEAITAFVREDALIQIPQAGDESEFIAGLHEQFSNLLDHEARRRQLGANALKVINDNSGSAVTTVKKLKELAGVE